MATIINNPGETSDSSGNGMGFLLGVILLIVVGFLAINYGIPYLNRATTAPQINVPGKIDVNVNNPGNTGGTTTK